MEHYIVVVNGHAYTNECSLQSCIDYAILKMQMYKQAGKDFTFDIIDNRTGEVVWSRDESYSVGIFMNK